MDPIEKAIEDVCRSYGLTKQANMAMLRRFHEFSRLAEHSHPEIQAIGQKLVAQNARQIPKPFAPVIAPVVQKLSAALGQVSPGMFSPSVLNKSQNSIAKATGQSKLKPGIKGPLETGAGGGLGGGLSVGK